MFSGTANTALHTFNINEVERRLAELEHKILRENNETPQVLFEVKDKLNVLRERLETMDYLSWLGLYKDLSTNGGMQPFWNKSVHPGKKAPEICQKVFEKFNQLSQVHITAEVKEYLRKPTFDNWQWDDAEMMILVRQMFFDLNFFKTFDIELPIFHNWLFEIYKSYNDVPFHNFKHCFMVTQMMYGLIWLISLHEKLDELDLLTLMISAICHDLDHPGYNNAYQVNARTELALRYNDISPLENHHCSVAFEILERPHCNILQNLSPEMFKKLREGMIRCILATDMAKHNDILKNFRSIIPVFDIKNKAHKDLLFEILLKSADISNEARPVEVSELWLECLLEEYFRQSDMEKLEGLPVAPFMDREKVTKSSSQIGFIKFVLLPLFESLAEIFPVMTNDIVLPVQRALEYYTEMQETEQKRKETTTDVMHQRLIPDDLQSNRAKFQIQSITRFGSRTRMLSSTLLSRTSIGSGMQKLESRGDSSAHARDSYTD